MVTLPPGGHSQNRENKGPELAAGAKFVKIKALRDKIVTGKQLSLAGSNVYLLGIDNITIIVRERQKSRSMACST